MDVTIEQAREALDSLDDFARMDNGVDAHGPRGVLERFIAQQAAFKPAGSVIETVGGLWTVGWYGESPAVSTEVFVRNAGGAS